MCIKAVKRVEREERVNVGTVSNVSNKMVEFTVNTEFTDFITNNYEKLIGEVGKFGAAQEFHFDLINDVWRSYKLAEENGKGYDMGKGTKGGYITLEEAVYGRIKKYAQNDKYKRATEAPKYNKATERYEAKEISSSSLNEDISLMTGCQKAYMQMSSYDNLVEVEDRISLAENINYLMSFEDTVGLPVISAIENIVKMRDNLQNIDMRLFSKFRSAGEDFREAFTLVYNAAFSDPDGFTCELSKVRNELGEMRSIMK